VPQLRRLGLRRGLLLPTKQAQLVASLADE